LAGTANKFALMCYRMWRQVLWEINLRLIFIPPLLLLFVIYCGGKIVAGPAPQYNMRYADCGRPKCTTSGIGL